MLAGAFIEAALLYHEPEVDATSPEDVLDRVTGPWLLDIGMTAIVKQAYEESSAPTKAFLELLAAHPDQWLSIGEIRDELGIGVHELPGVLSTFPRRWRGRYRQAGPLPFEVEGKGSQRRYRMGQEVAELITSLG